MNRVDGLLNIPEGARCLYVMAHGAGAGMRHPFLETTAHRLAARGIASFRYEFPYMTLGRRRPDSPKVLQETVRLAVRTACGKAPGLPIVAGGKSLGGRMTSMAAATEALPSVDGIVFLGFPLHAPGSPGDARAEHLERVDVPMLFLQGTRDSLADIQLMKIVCKRLGDRVTLRIIEGGDHSFKVLKRSGRGADEIMDEIAAAIAQWTETVI